MSDHQFLALLAVVLLGFLAVGFALPWAVERAIASRLAELKAMMAAALAHGGSIDTLARDVRGRVDAANEISRKAGEAVSLIRKQVDEHEARLREIEGHPVIRRLGGGGK